MKLLIASDIHGSAYYAKKVVESFEKEKADKLLLLGDILYHGPRNDLPFEHNPKEVIALLNPLSDRILCVRGNCEAEVDQMVLDFPCLADYIIVNVDGINIFATHGHIFGENNPIETMAEMAGTIPYELVCAVSKRVHRIYIEHGEVVDKELMLRM